MSVNQFGRTSGNAGGVVFLSVSASICVVVLWILFLTSANDFRRSTGSMRVEAPMHFSTGVGNAYGRLSGGDSSGG